MLVRVQCSFARVGLMMTSSGSTPCLVRTVVRVQPLAVRSTSPSRRARPAGSATCRCRYRKVEEIAKPRRWSMTSGMPPAGGNARTVADDRTARWAERSPRRGTLTLDLVPVVQSMDEEARPQTRWPGCDSKRSVDPAYRRVDHHVKVLDRRWWRGCRPGSVPARPDPTRALRRSASHVAPDRLPLGARWRHAGRRSP